MAYGPRNKPWYWDTVQGGRNFNTALMSTSSGREFVRGLGSSIGMGFAGKSSIPSWVSGGGEKVISAYQSMIPKQHAYTGILGWKGEQATIRAERAAFAALGARGRVGLNRTMSGAAYKNIGKVTGKRVLGIGGRFLGRSLGPVMVGYSAYKGYKEGGILKGAWEGGKEAAGWAAFSVAASLLPGAAAIATPIAAAAAIGYGAYQFGEKAQAYRKGLRDVEMGGGFIDPFGTGATMRQRSAMALQNSHINGRSALGAEGSLYHR